jgi:MFS transporter, DHA1 family, multidrug resistance protein
MIDRITKKQLHTEPPQNKGAEESATPGWRVLAVLSLLMGFAAISTDLYLL